MLHLFVAHPHPGSGLPFNLLSIVYLSFQNLMLLMICVCRSNYRLHVHEALNVSWFGNIWGNLYTFFLEVLYKYFTINLKAIP